MIISKDRAYVWIYLPEESKPVVAGMIRSTGTKYLFTYGKSYLAHKNAISIFPEELPLQKGTFIPRNEIASCLRDSSPDAWGRRVIIHSLYDSGKIPNKEIEIDEITFFLHSGSDRVGALDFPVHGVRGSPVF